MRHQDPGSSSSYNQTMKVKMGWLRWEWLKLIITGVLTVLLWVALQTTVLSHIPLPFLSPAAPSLVLLWVMAVGFFMGEREGAVMGVLGGSLLDIAMGETIILLPLVYTLCGYLIGVLSKDRLAHNLPSFWVWVILGGVWEQMTVYVRWVLSVGGFPPADLWTRDLLPCLLLTLLFAPVIYFTAKLLMKIFVRK